jgi:hypothetical protein
MKINYIYMTNELFNVKKCGLKMNAEFKRMIGKYDKNSNRSKNNVFKIEKVIKNVKLI